MHTPTPEYEYKPKWPQILGYGAFFALGAVFMGFMAAGNDRGLVIDGVIRLGQGGATVFYWSVSICCFALFVPWVLLAYHRLAYRQRLALGAEGLIVPASQWSREEKMIAYRDIHVILTELCATQ